MMVAFFTIEEDNKGVAIIYETNYSRSGLKLYKHLVESGLEASAPKKHNCEECIIHINNITMEQVISHIKEYFG